MVKVLSEISEYEFKQSRPLLSSLVLLKGRTGKQMDEFYKLCEELGMGGWEDLKSNPDFESEQRKSCHLFWKENQNYKEYRFIYDEVV